MLEHQIQRLHRRIQAMNAPHAVVHQGRRFDLIAASSPRLESLLKSPAWARRVLGVFSPDVSYADLVRELRV